MNKLAIFVEGKTEQIFAEKLVLHMGRRQRVGVRVERLQGGKRTGGRTVTEIQGTSEAGDHQYFVLIVDCGQDASVASDIRERYPRLVASNYQLILGIRDVYPRGRTEIQQLRDGFRRGMPNRPIEPLLVLAIMEAEAWFLAEYTHFSRIHPALTVDRIERELGFNPARDDVQLRDRPSTDLENVYFLETLNYHKTREHVERTVNSLDFSLVQDVLSVRISDLGALVSTIQQFFMSA